jgi:phosphohistidine phosphatase
MTQIDLYIIRHGLAGEHGTYANDAERPLTEEGRRKTRQVAKRLREFGLHFDLLLTSPLVRAQQTAEILEDVGLTAQLQQADFLAPGGSIAAWVNWLVAWQPPEKASLAIVGHEPDLSTWAEQLLWGEVRGVLELKKTGVIGLKLLDHSAPIAHSVLFWLTPPRFLL